MDHLHQRVDHPPDGKSIRKYCLKWYFKLDGVRYLQNIPPKSNRMHILLKFTHNISQDHILGHKLEIMSKIFSDHNYII